MFILHSAQHNTAKDTNMTIVYAGHYTLLIVITMTRQHKNVTSPQSILWTLTFWPWAHTAYSASVHHMRYGGHYQQQIAVLQLMIYDYVMWRCDLNLWPRQLITYSWGHWLSIQISRTVNCSQTDIHYVGESNNNDDNTWQYRYFYSTIDNHLCPDHTVHGYSRELFARPLDHL